MKKKLFTHSAFVILFLWSIINYGQMLKQSTVLTKIEYSPEYIFSADNNKDIETISFNLIYGWEYSKNTALTLGTGMTITHAWGTISRWTTKNKKIHFNNNTFGVGPVLFLKYEPYNYRNFSVSPELSGGVILYSENFPTGGDIYNFMLRIGSSINYRMPNKKYGISLNAKWMHVSNGKGAVPENPMYEGFGFGIAITRYLKSKNNKP